MKYSQNRGKVLNVQDARTSSSLGREMPLKPPRARATTHPVLSGSSRQKRAAKIVGIVDQPRRVHRYVAGLSAVAFSLSIVAVAVTCPTFNSEHADTQPAVEHLNVPIPQLARRAPNSSPVEAQTELTDKKLSEIIPPSPSWRRNLKRLRHPQATRRVLLILSGRRDTKLTRRYNPVSFNAVPALTRLPVPSRSTKTYRPCRRRFTTRFPTGALRIFIEVELAAHLRAHARLHPVSTLVWPSVVCTSARVAPRSSASLPWRAGANEARRSRRCLPASPPA